MQGKKPPLPPLGDVAVAERPKLNPRMIQIPKPRATLPEGLPRECWDEVVRELIIRNIWDTDLRDMVEAYCVQRARFIEANDKIADKGLILKSRKGDAQIGKVNPYVRISNNSYDRMVRLAAELGLTAVRRGSVQRSANAATPAGAEKFLRTK